MSRTITELDLAVGDTIKLVATKMTVIPIGTIGVVEKIEPQSDGNYHVEVDWEDTASVAPLVLPDDKYRVIEDEE